MSLFKKEEPPMIPYDPATQEPAVRSSIDFYRSLGAAQMDEWATYRATGETLQKLTE